MATFEGTYTDKLVVHADVNTARDHFANLETIVANTKDLEQADIDNDTIHFLLEAQEHTGIGTFQGKYSCRYAVTDGVLSWESVGDGNTRQSGRATFTAVDGGATEVDYTESIAIDMDVPKLMAPMLKPLIGPMLKHELSEYAKRMVKSLG